MKTKIMAVAVILSIGIFACKKDETPSPTPNTAGPTNEDVSSSEDDALVESLFESTQNVVDEGLEESDNPSLRKLLKRPGNCADANITINDVAGTATVVYTFAGETCDDGRTRSGSITLVANKKSFRENGAVLTMTFDNYKVDGHSISAKRVITNKAAVDATTGRYQSVIVTGADGTGSATITKPDGTKIMWHAEKTRKQIAGADTRSKFDDKFEISGEQGGTSSKGHVYLTTVSSATPVVLDNSCLKYRVVSGVRTVTRNGKTFTINYGDGTCDNKIVVTDSDSKEHDVTVGRTGTIPASTGKISTDANSITGADVETAIAAASANVAVNASGDVTTIVKNVDGTVTRTVAVKHTNETWTTTIRANGTTYTKVEKAGETDVIEIKGFLTKEGTIIGRADIEGDTANFIIKADNSAVVTATDEAQGKTFTVIRAADGSSVETEKKDGVKTQQIVRGTDGVKTETRYEAGVRTEVIVEGTDGVRTETRYETDGTTVQSVTTEQPDGTRTTVDGSGNVIATVNK
jgi:hypothetical protein